MDFEPSVSSPFDAVMNATKIPGWRVLAVAVLCLGLCFGACGGSGAGEGADAGETVDAGGSGSPSARTSQMCSGAGVSENEEYTLIQCTGPAELQGPELEGEKYRLQLGTMRAVSR